MCGICGAWNTSGLGIDPTFLITMRDSMAHRGPDGAGCILFPKDTGIKPILYERVGEIPRMNFSTSCPVGLAHRRLSIIDLTSGDQPMTNEDQTIWIVFNGEIYNFRELRREFEARGHIFRSSSDTEVILHAYEEYGAACPSHLNGIFAFAIWDIKRRQLLLARDHFGVKPLYYTVTNNGLVFASEIKAILRHPDVRRVLDFEAFNSFFTYRYNPSPQTLFKGIKKLIPGHYLKISLTGRIDLESFWKYVPKHDLKIAEEEAISEYQRLLEQAVGRQMISDVPVGLLLSGGVDSAAIGYLMQNHTPENIKTFTTGFPGVGDFNELEDARETAHFIHSDHYDITITQEQYMDFFFESFYYTEEPIAETTIPALYFVSKLAANHVKVVLAGQGADEPLAGYKRYFGEYYLNKYSKILRALPLEKLVKWLPRNERIRRAAYASQFDNEKDRFLGIYTIFTPEQKARLFNDDVKKKTSDVDAILMERLYDQCHGLQDSLSKLLFIDTRMSLSDDLLLFGDKMTMANSLEMRVPFLDVDLVQFLERLSSKFKLKGFTHKYIHKKAVKQWLPKEIINRKKRGFQTPMDNWLQQGFAETVKSLLNERQSSCRRYFNLDYVNEMIDLHKARKQSYQRHLFALLSFELWHRNFFEART